jgi:hypothetical protein
MTHRSAGVDQILRLPSRPAIQEPVMRDVRGYVALAEAVKWSHPKPGSAMPTPAGVARLDEPGGVPLAARW